MIGITALILCSLPALFPTIRAFPLSRIQSRPMKIRLPKIPTISSIGSSYGAITIRPSMSQTSTNSAPNSAYRLMFRALITLEHRDQIGNDQSNIGNTAGHHDDAGGDRRRRSSIPETARRYKARLRFFEKSLPMPTMLKWLANRNAARTNGTTRMTSS